MTRLGLAGMVCLWLAVGCPAWGIDASEPFDDPALEARYRNFIEEIRCPKCQNNTLADSPAPLVEQTRLEIREMMASGATDAEIIDFLTARYGDFVLFRPPLRPSTWALWFGPFVMVAIGAAVVWRVVQRHRNEPIEADDDGPDDPDYATR